MTHVGNTPTCHVLLLHSSQMLLKVREVRPESESVLSTHQGGGGRQRGKTNKERSKTRETKTTREKQQRERKEEEQDERNTEGPLWKQTGQTENK